MKYEIINPSDKCYITSDIPIVASAANILLGNGAYGLRDEEGTSVCGIYLFGGDPDVDFKELFGETLSEFLEKPDSPLKIAECLETFEYAGERTSLNNIGSKAASIATKIRKKIDTDA